MKLSSLAVGALLAVTPWVVQAADPVTGSREYKLMLDPTLFSGNATAAVIAYWADLEDLIESPPFDRSTDGNLDSVSKSRTVRFFDTPGSCVLNHDGYIFRERVEGTDREVTLKFRSADRFISHYKDMSGSNSGAQTKFEEDISAPFTSKYSHSTTQPISSSKNLNYMDDPVGLYPGLEDQDYNLNEPIAVVGGLSVYEQVYADAYVDLGALDAEFSLTLWYPYQGASTPLVAEISFKYEDASADYSENVVNRAQVLYTAMQGMSPWVAPSALTKTAFIYAYNPSFCY